MGNQHLTTTRYTKHKSRYNAYKTIDAGSSPNDQVAFLETSAGIV